MLNKGKLIIVFIALKVTINCVGIAYSQPPVTYEKYIRATSGTNVHLHINSLTRYEYGYELSNWTRLEVNIPDSVSDEFGNFTLITDWFFNAYTDSDSLYGDYGRSIGVDYITLTASAGNTEAGNRMTFIEDGIELGSVPQELARGTGPGRFIILVSFSIGQKENKRLIGEPFDYYFSDLWFQIYSE